MMNRSLRVRLGLRTILRAALALGVLAACSGFFFDEKTVIVPGLTAQGGKIRIGREARSNGDEYKEYLTASATPSGSVEFWVWLVGDAATLENLKSSGALPIRHEVRIQTGGWLQNIPVENQYNPWQTPDKLKGYFSLLSTEVREKSRFIASSLSTYSLGIPAASCEVRLKTSDGRLLAGSNGRPLVVKVNLTR